ncbi:autotransporter outer membrane beta-barrel domain-containing protein [Achromobacter sp. K91]|uniref:autotransporter-associated beta strand repeat-containing protein n=1 Tax=Achromobacter sp. K91 TaxID=2292262 RepID=UPI000E66762A|nr:autotransporter-associated beta strand repeat-containing protein [Achromobacter sp. K91]RIJ00992.1 autotransporter outer membrane beta-barrel domain-containing protein [Achromobacter sp. K91]
MNHVYRVVFNATAGVWQAVSEIARGPAKSSSPARRLRRGGAQLAGALGIAVVAANTHAAPANPQLYWDGSQSVANGSVDGASGIWDYANTNWTSADGTVNQSWNGGEAAFSGAAGTVAVGGQHSITGLEFKSDGYKLVGGANGQLNTSGMAVIQVNPNVTATLGVAIGGSGTLHKQDSGTLILNGNNTYTGGTIIEAGRLEVGSNTALGNGALTALNNTVLDANNKVALGNYVNLWGSVEIGGSADLTLNGVVYGLGSLIKNGAANLTLNGANTYLSGTTLNAGTLTVGNDQALGLRDLTVGGNATLTANKAVSLSNGIALNATLAVTGDNVLSLNGAIFGVGQLVKTGNGTLSLGGPNSYSGGVVLGGGTLELNADSALGTGPLVANGTATLKTQQVPVLMNAISVNGDLTLDTPNLLGMNGMLSGSGKLTKTGVGELVLASINTYSGDFNIAQGSVTTVGVNGLGTPTSVDLAFGTDLNLNGPTSIGSLTGAGRMNIGIGSVVSVGGNNSNSVYAGEFIGNGTLNKVGTGTLELAGISTLTSMGQVSQVNGGTLRVTGTFNGPGMTVGSGGTLTGSGTVGGVTTIANDGHLAGTSGSTLKLDNLILSPNSNVDVALGSPYSGNTPLFNVTNNLTLGGKLNISDAGNLGDGVYRLFDHGGGLTNNGMVVDTSRVGGISGMTLQTATPTQVNLLVQSGLQVQAWDGSDQFPNGLVDGGSGTWSATSPTSNWTTADGMMNQTWLGQFAVFMGSTGTVEVEGAHTIGGMQFMTDGYHLLAGNNAELQANNGTRGRFAVRVDPNVTATIDVPISGLNTLRKLDLGTLVLNGANSHAGTLLEGGTLVLGNNAALGQGPLAVYGGTTLDNNKALTLTNYIIAEGPLNLGGSNDLTLNGNIVGSGLIKNGSGTLTLGGNNSFGGTMALNGGKLVLASSNPLGNSTLTAASGMQLDNSVALSLSNTINLAGDLNLVGNQDLTLGGLVNGLGGLTKRGTGKLTLNGANSFQGGVNLTGGNLAVGHDAALGEGTLTVRNAGTLEASRAVTLANNVQLSASLALDGSNDFTLNGVINGSTELVKNGAGRLTLNGENRHSGGTTVNAGDLSLGNAAALGTGMLTVTGNTQLDTAGPMRLGNTVNVDGALTVAGNNSLILDGQLNGNGTLRKTGANDLSLTGSANTFSGMIDLQGGSLTTAGNNALGQNATANVAAGANLFITNLARLASLNGNGTVTVSNGNNLTIGANGANSNFGGQLDGKGWLTKSGTGSLVLSGNNTLTGQTSVSAGSLWVDGSLASTNVMVYSGAALGGTGSIAGDVTLMGGAALKLTDGYTLSVGGLQLGTNSIVNASLGAPALGGGTALVDVTGNLTLGGTLNISDAGGFGTGVYRLMNYGGSLTNNGMNFGYLPGNVQAADLTLQTAVDKQINLLVAAPNVTVQFWDGSQTVGNGAIEGGNGTWDGANANWTGVDGNGNRSWAGKFAVFQGAAGKVTVAGAQSTTGMQFMTDGYVLERGSLGSLNLVNGDQGYASVRVDPGVTATINVPLVGSGTLAKLDAGTLVLNASNGYTGGTALNGGTLVLGNDKALGNGLLTAANGTTLDSNTAVTVRNKVALNGALTIAGSNAMDLNATVGGAGGLIKNGAANLTLSGVNSYVGGTLLNAGGLIVGNGAALGSGTLTVGGAATLDNTQALALANNIALNAGLAVQGSHDLTLDGNISGAGSLTKNGASTLTLNGTNSYTGGTYVNSGTVALGAGSSLAATGIVTVANGATFDLSAGQGAQVFGTLAGAGNIKMGTNTLLAGGSADGIFSGSVIGTGTLVKQGSGTQTLTGANSYTGGTLVADGTLRAGSTTALVQGTGYQVLSGATLDLNGNVLQASSLTGAGTVALGAGTLTVNSAAGSASYYSGIVVGSGGLVKTGAGALTLTGGSAFSGGVQLKQGSIGLGHSLGLGTGMLSMDDGTVINLIANGLTIVNNLHMTGTNDPVIDTGANTATWAGAITGGGFLTKQGSGVLTLTSAGNSYTGATDVAQGTLKAGATNTFSSASAHTVASGAVLDLAGYSQTVASLNNSGAVNLGGSTPGTVLKVTGPYVGNNGKLGVSTVLGADGSATDKLLLSGPSAIASGSTSVQITNAGGLGAQTGSQGIQVISTENGASLQPGSFTLAGGHVDAGAYEYRLTQTAQGAALHSTNTQVNPGPGTDPVTPAPAYREEVPLLSSLPAQLRQADMAMLGDMRKRMGDDVAQGAIDQDPNHRAWARVLRTAPTITQQGTVNPESSGHLTGFQAGVDVYADRNLKAGLYVGQLDGDMGVRGFSSGMERKYAGYNNLRGRYVGLYGTWQHDSGLYADAVIQGADYRSSLRTADTGAGATTKGHGWLASLEVGKPFDLGSSWQLEPQAQIIYRKLNLDDTTLSLAKVKNDADDDWTLRLGARVKGSYSIGGTVLQPFARVNLYKASNTTDVASFSAPAGTTDIRAKGGYTSTEFAVGAMLQLTKNTSLYGDIGKLWANSGDSRVKTGAQGSVGLKVLW